MAPRIRGPVRLGRREGRTVRDDRTNRGPLVIFRNLKTAAKLMVGFLAVSMLMVAVGVIGISKLASAQANLKAMYSENVQAIAWLGEVNTTFVQTRLNVTNFALTIDTAEMATLTATLPTLDALNTCMYTA